MALYITATYVNYQEMQLLTRQLSMVPVTCKHYMQYVTYHRSMSLHGGHFLFPWVLADFNPKVAIVQVYSVHMVLLLLHLQLACDIIVCRDLLLVL